MQNITLSVNDLSVKAHFYKSDTEDIFIPLLKYLTRLYKEKKRRIIVFIGAAPGAGKSTLVKYLEKLAKENAAIKDITAIGIDGFHHYNTYLKSHYIDDDQKLPLLSIKGAPSTFDVDKFLDKLKKMRDEDVMWPEYSRKLHDPIEDAIIVKEDIVLIEGNYLLLDEGKWQTASKYADLKIYIKANKDDLKDDLIKRKMQSGMPYNMTLAHYENVDGKNYDIVNRHSKGADITLFVDKKKHYRIIDQKVELK